MEARSRALPSARRRRSRGAVATRLAVGLVAAALAVVGFASGASAGGWAVTTLDETPVPAAGEPLDVGFTIRQHGVTPVDLDDVALLVTTDGGTTMTFPAVGDGRTGHYVATITVPDPGPAKWSVRQGWFGEQELGSLSVSPPSAATAVAASSAQPATSQPAAAPATTTTTTTTTSYRFPWVLRYGLPALAVLLAGAALADAMSGRARRHGAVATH